MLAAFVSTMPYSCYGMAEGGIAQAPRGGVATQDDLTPAQKAQQTTIANAKAAAHDLKGGLTGGKDNVKASAIRDICKYLFKTYGGKADFTNGKASDEAFIDVLKNLVGENGENLDTVVNEIMEGVKNSVSACMTASVRAATLPGGRYTAIDASKQYLAFKTTARQLDGEIASVL